MVARATVADHADSLDFDLDSGPGKVRHGDQRAAGIISVLEKILAHFDEPVAVAGFLDENRHGHDIVQAAAGAFENGIDLGKNLLDLRIEICAPADALMLLARILAV